MEAFETLLVEVSDGVATVTLTGESSANAVNGAMHRELAHIFTLLQDSEDCDLVVLTGAGDFFSAGGDMGWFEEMIDDPAKFRSIAVEGKRIVNSLLELEKPIICRLNGAAAGLGATIALMCDVIVASDNAVIGDPHVRVGLVAGDGGAVIWPQLIGFARAKEYLMTGEMLTAQHAYEIGLLNHVVSPENLDSKVEEVAAKILRNPRWAVRWTKTAVNVALREMAVKTMDAGLAYELNTNMLEDRKEAVAAFREKRQPSYTGD